MEFVRCSNFLMGNSRNVISFTCRRTATEASVCCFMKMESEESMKR